MSRKYEILKNTGIRSDTKPPHEEKNESVSDSEQKSRDSKVDFILECHKYQRKENDILRNRLEEAELTRQGCLNELSDKNATLSKEIDNLRRRLLDVETLVKGFKKKRFLFF